jgi:glucose/mannose transport system substrate-binding protein
MADLMVEFWNDTSITVADAQARYVEIIATAD